MKVYGAPFGGPLAIIRDSTQIVPIKGTVKPVIRIFDTSGNELSRISVNSQILNFLFFHHKILMFSGIMES